MSNAFIKSFEQIARHKHRYEVFTDFVTMSAISFHNVMRKDQGLEDEYLAIAAKYSKEELSLFASLLAELVNLLQPKPTDILGGLFMSLNLGNKGTGQFFTPPEISSMMAQVSMGEKFTLPERGFITLSEPACGAGGMVLAFVDLLIQQKHNPLHHLWVQCVDIDRLAALMCYLQLSLWNVPAQIIVGNALSMKYREVFHTPAHYVGFWDSKIKRLQSEKNKKQTKTKEQEESTTLSSEIINFDDMVQTDLFENL